MILLFVVSFVVFYNNTPSRYYYNIIFVFVPRWMSVTVLCYLPGGMIIRFKIRRLRHTPPQKKKKRQNKKNEKIITKIIMI